MCHYSRRLTGGGRGQLPHTAQRLLGNKVLSIKGLTECANRVESVAGEL